MAPWPEQGEPKAPDKEDKQVSDEVITKRDSEYNSEISISPHNDQKSKPVKEVLKKLEDKEGSVLKLKQSTEEKEKEVNTLKVKLNVEEKEVNTLDEGQLKALLDEAISYKNPKDREGKSDIFKELLQEAEAADEGKCKGLGESLGSGKLPGGRHGVGGSGGRSKRRGRECGSGGGSLQNLHALASESAGCGSGSGRNRRRPPVSARQREGGSLPDVEFEALCPHFTSRASLDVVAATAPNTLETLDAQESCISNGLEAAAARPAGTSNKGEDLQRSRTSSSSGGGPGPSQQDSARHTNQPATSAPASAAHSPPTASASSSASASVGVACAPPAAAAAGQLCTLLGLGLGLPTPVVPHLNLFSSLTFLDFRDPGSRSGPIVATLDPSKKPVDENGNALGCTRVDVNVDPARKKVRRVKVKNDRNVIEMKADDVQGFRGDADIDSLLEYIDSPSNVPDGTKAKTATRVQNGGARNGVKSRAKEEDSRSTVKRRKEKLKRYNSLEEISKTKLEDLTEEGGPLQMTQDDAQLPWAGRRYQVPPPPRTPPPAEVDRVSPEAMVQDAEFSLVVKKRHGKKKRRSQGGTRVVVTAGGLVTRGRVARQDAQRRRKSASSVPPSDKSDSSDLDSVHSLPDAQRLADVSVSGDSTPQASYADIARTEAGGTPLAFTRARFDTPRQPAEALPSLPKNVRPAVVRHTVYSEEYPPLGGVRNVDAIKDSPAASVKAREVIEKDCIPDSKISVKTAAPDSRPAVILLDEAAAPSNPPPPELTFGFEVNQQLLAEASGDIDVRCDPALYPPTISSNLAAYLAESFAEALRKVELGTARYWDAGQ